MKETRGIRSRRARQQSARSGGRLLPRGHFDASTQQSRQRRGRRTLSMNVSATWPTRIPGSGTRNRPSKPPAAPIVCWGPHQSQRQEAINKLHQVLAAAKDLDAYVGTPRRASRQVGARQPDLAQSDRPNLSKPQSVRQSHRPIPIDDPTPADRHRSPSSADWLATTHRQKNGGNARIAGDHRSRPAQSVPLSATRRSIQ